MALSSIIEHTMSGIQLKNKEQNVLALGSLIPSLTGKGVKLKIYIVTSWYIEACANEGNLKDTTLGLPFSSTTSKLYNPVKEKRDAL